MITTATHTISARYSIENGINSYEVSTNGSTLPEIIREMLEFANWMPGLARTFDVTSETSMGDGVRVIIEGEYYRVNADGDYTEETDAVIIVIEAWEK